MAAHGASQAEIDGVTPHRVCVGERPSNTILFGRLDPFSLGRLIALYEHKVAVQGCVWGIDSFDQWGGGAKQGTCRGHHRGAGAGVWCPGRMIHPPRG